MFEGRWFVYVVCWWVGVRRRIEYVVGISISIVVLFLFVFFGLNFCFDKVCFRLVVV